MLGLALVLLTATATPEILADVPAPAESNAPVSIRVRLVDPERTVARLDLLFRREGVRRFSTVSARADDVLSIVIPALAIPPDPGGYRMEYALFAYDAVGGLLAQQGSRGAPLSFAVLAGPDCGDSDHSVFGLAVLGLGATTIAAAMAYAATPPTDEAPVAALAISGTVLGGVLFSLLLRTPSTECVCTD